jgi:hypothetical protein
MDAPTLNGIAMCQSGGVYQPLEQTEASDISREQMTLQRASTVLAGGFRSIALSLAKTCSIFTEAFEGFNEISRIQT